MSKDFNRENSSSYDVIIIGGGATGAGTARDCAKRGLKTLMLERFDIATGATGRNHGLLHSGSRYAVTDKESAEECIKENMILKKVARHCTEATDGFFLTLPEDDLEFQKNFIKSCQEAGIDAIAVDPKEALRLDPSINKNIIGAVRVPDGTVDPFQLTLSNILDAKYNGADILTYTEVLGLIIENGRVIGVETISHKTNEKSKIYGKIIVNAGGIWGQKIAEYGDLSVKMFPAKGSLLIFGHRVNKFVLNRCRKPADADILVPGDTICLIGTTSTRVPFEEVDNMKVTSDEVDILIREGEKMAPILNKTRILRGYAGVRPLVAKDNDPTGRSVSRGIVLLDHEERDGLPGFITITGGKLMTYRLMAEWCTDLICKKLGNTNKCTTAEDYLPGSKQASDTLNEEIKNIPTPVKKSAIYRMGEEAKKLPNSNKILENSLVCECEEVSAGEVEYSIENLHVNNMIDLRRRTRVGMGTCQGELCACRAVGLMSHYGVYSCEKAKEDLAFFLNERWKGIMPISWGDTLRESEYSSWIYEGLCGLKNNKLKEEQIK